MWPSCWKWRERALRRVDRQLREVRAAQPLQLRVEVREVAALQQRVVGEVDAGHDVLRAERHLLGLGEEVVDRAVEHQPADAPDRHQLLRDDLGRDRARRSRSCRRTRRRRPAGRAPTRGSRRPRSRPSRSRRWKSGSAPLIFTASFHTTDCRPSLGFQWNFTKRRLALGVDEPEGVDAEALHEPERARDRRGPTWSTSPCASTLGHQRDEVPEVVVGRSAPAGSRGRAPASPRGSRSGNLIASWMKNTGMLLPTRSQLPSCV